MNLRNVTVIIPAHNRPERLRRLLRYYRNTGIRVIVPDSSVKRFDGISEFPDVVYRHLPSMSFLDKLREVIDLIETDYVLWCADDDFTVPEAIAEIVEFMDANPDYSVVQGHYLTFEPSKDWKTATFTPRYIRKFDSRIDHDSPRERLLDEKSLYASTLYAVTRREVFQKMYRACYREDGTPLFTNLYAAEEFFIHATLIAGKYATLPVFYSARERIPGSATSTTVPMAVVKTSPEYAGEYSNYLDILGRLLSEAEGSDFADAREFIRRISDMPKAESSVSLKRKVLGFIGRHRLLSPLSKLADRRYVAKGLKAVEGLQSYPCKFSTPEREAITSAIRSTWED